MTDDEAQAAKDTLECAIRDYYLATEPDALVSSWVLVTHKMTNDEDPVGVLSPTGQSFVLTRGILDVALQGERNSQSFGTWEEDDD